MDFEFTFEQQMIQDSARKTFEKHYPMEEVRKFGDSPAINRKFAKIVAESGTIGILAKEEMDGLGLGAVDAIPVLMEAGRSLLPFPLLENIIGSKILADANVEIAKEIVSGDKIATIAWSGLVEGQYNEQSNILSGRFELVSFAGDVDCMVAPINGKLYYMNLKNGDVTIERMNSMDLTYPAFRVSVSNYSLEGAEIVGDGLYEKMMNLGALLISAEMVGAAEKAMLDSVEYSKVRIQFGQPIGTFQAVKHMAADCYVLLESARLATEYAAWAMDQNENDLSLSVAKGYTSDAAQKITQIAVQMQGGIGFTWENDTHFYLKRVLRSSQSLGNSYTHREAIASKIIG